MSTIGNRKEVMNGLAEKTGGGLRKNDLKYNKYGKIVSKRMSAIAKKENRLQKAGYYNIKGQFGSFKMKGGVTKKELHDELIAFNKEILNNLNIYHRNAKIMHVMNNLRFEFFGYFTNFLENKDKDHNIEDLETKKENFRKKYDLFMKKINKTKTQPSATEIKLREELKHIHSILNLIKVSGTALDEKLELIGDFSTYFESFLKSKNGHTNTHIVLINKKKEEFIEKYKKFVENIETMKKNTTQNIIKVNDKIKELKADINNSDIFTFDDFSKIIEKSHEIILRYSSMKSTLIPVFQKIIKKAFLKAINDTYNNNKNDAQITEETNELRKLYNQFKSVLGLIKSSNATTIAQINSKALSNLKKNHVRPNVLDENNQSPYNLEEEFNSNNATTIVKAYSNVLNRLKKNHVRPNVLDENSPPNIPASVSDEYNQSPDNLEEEFNK